MVCPQKVNIIFGKFNKMEKLIFLAMVMMKIQYIKSRLAGAGEMTTVAK